MTTTNWLTLDEKSLTAALREASQVLARSEGELGLDFSAIRRIDSSALQALEEFADFAGEKGAKVVVRGINPSVYRVLKLLKLASRFSFAKCGGDRAGAALEGSYAQPSTK
jgi:anti-anti-sigma regulatory factor